MSLAARCPACGTVFRVVQDQLRVSEGWVRCGRCAEVFNAIESLVDLDADAAARPASRRDSETAAPGRERVLEDLAQVARQRHESDAVHADEAGEVGSVDLEVPVEEPSESPTTAAARDADPPAPRATPTFVVQADRAARWRRPGVRLGLLATLVAGTLGLGAQVAIEYRDSVAARWPVLREPLEQWCAVQGCRVEAPRMIEALAVESSGLVRAEGTSAYRLSVVLRNRAGLALALPAIDLTLTDTQGAVIARRVVQPAEFGVTQRSVPALADLTLQALITTSERAISGYTIEVFYP